MLTRIVFFIFGTGLPQFRYVLSVISFLSRCFSLRQETFPNEPLTAEQSRARNTPCWTAYDAVRQQQLY